MPQKSNDKSVSFLTGSQSGRLAHSDSSTTPLQLRSMDSSVAYAKAVMGASSRVSASWMVETATSHEFSRDHHVQLSAAEQFALERPLHAVLSSDNAIYIMASVEASADFSNVPDGMHSPALPFQAHWLCSEQLTASSEKLQNICASHAGQNSAVVK